MFLYFSKKVSVVFFLLELVCLEDAEFTYMIVQLFFFFI